MSRKRPSIVIRTDSNPQKPRASQPIAQTKTRQAQPQSGFSQDDSRESISQPEARLKYGYSSMLQLKNYLHILDQPSLQMAASTKRQVHGLIQAELQARRIEIGKVMRKIEKTGET